MEGCNPFAPSLVESDGAEAVLSDQKSVEGVFQNWRYAYIFKDTLVYSDLLSEEFYFAFINFDNGGVPITWGRQEDMFSTAGLFRAAQTIDLIWNDALFSYGDSLSQNITRGFNLQVNFSIDEVMRIQGRAVVELKRTNTNDKWRITSWRDESNY